MADLYITTSSLTAASGWTDYGSGYAGMDVVRSNRMVSTQFLIKTIADRSVTSGVNYVIATIPVGFRPLSDTLSPGWCVVAGAYYACRITLRVGGNIEFFAPVTGTMTAGYWVGADVSYRVA